MNQRGYVEGYIWTEDGTIRRIKQHRLVAENTVGRLLQPDEDVHHIDGNKTNNDPSNLAVLPHAEHSRISNAGQQHRKGYRLNLTDEDRQRRSERMREMRAKAIARADGSRL